MGITVLIVDDEEPLLLSIAEGLSIYKKYFNLNNIIVRRINFIFLNLAISNMNNAISIIGHIHFMGYKNYGVSFFIEFLKCFHNYMTGLRVQISRRFIS